jgi:ADP-ribosyl-[dinitrogen reductase] hydrolase
MTVPARSGTGLDSDRVRGCLLGLAVGDILGCPVEGMSPLRIREEFGRLDDLVETPVQHLRDTYFWRLSGLHSDDTQQALAITDNLVEYGEIDEKALLDLWKEMSAAYIVAPSAKTGRLKKRKEGFGSHRGIGNGFRNRIKRLAFPPPPSNGDGAAMRVAPVGVRFFEDQVKRVDNAVRSALATSSHPHAAASAAAIAAAAALCLNSDFISPEEFIVEITGETRIAEEYLYEKYSDRIDPQCKGAINELSHVLGQLAGWLKSPLRDVLDKIAHSAEEYLGLHGLFATKSFALTAIPTSILVAARHLNDFREGVIEAINLGGDTDTIGAITGAILGTRNGVESIPDIWREKVIAHDQILLRSDALVTGEKGPGWVPLYDLEKELTTSEAMARSKLRAELIRKAKSGVTSCIVNRK